jgi:endonuclease YncB( thermonuclease family)
MSKTAAIAVLLVAFTSSPPQTHAAPLPEGVTVRDGDTVVIQKQTYRFWGIDAPELHQTCGDVHCGPMAKEALINLVAAGGISCDEHKTTDKYSRIVATCRDNAGADIAEKMVRAGWAWDYPRYSNGAYLTVQQEAQSNRTGMWSASIVEPPWQWRMDKGHCWVGPWNGPLKSPSSG